MNTEKDEQLLRKRILELARTADNKGINTFTDFLNLNEQSIFFSMKNELPNVKLNIYVCITSISKFILVTSLFKYSLDVIKA